MRVDLKLQIVDELNSRLQLYSFQIPQTSADPEIDPETSSG